MESNLHKLAMNQVYSGSPFEPERFVISEMNGNVYVLIEDGGVILKDTCYGTEGREAVLVRAIFHLLGIIDRFDGDIIPKSINKL